uniref:Reverse transcriptase domain-containing protein n=1 Tax=Triticum urartu TaxID=4572 RepID=A0A8R7PAR9_TRIUA
MGYILQIHEMESENNKENTPPPVALQPLLQKYADIFEESQKLPPKRPCDHRIVLQEGAKPPNLRPYRVPHYQKAAMEEIIKQLIKKGEIQESFSPFSSPAIMIKKKDGGWRLYMDYRELNAIIIKNKFPMPIIEGLLDELYGAKVFYKLDLRSGYHQIRMSTTDIPKTAFRTHMGHYEYTVVPFGVSGAPGTSQGFMNKVCEEINEPEEKKCILVFFDDMLIFSKSLKEHIGHLERTFATLRKHEVSVKMSKCTFAKNQVHYLGHVISEQGVSTDPGKIKDVLDWLEPDNATKLRGFLGLTGYYRRFVKDYGKNCRPLHDMLRKDSFQWESAQKQAFHTLKQAMTTCPILAVRDFSVPFTIEADACATGIGAVIMQKGKPLAYLSQSLGPKSAAQSIYEKEAMDILEALKKWRHYVWGNKLIIKTDQQSLKYMTTQRLTEGVQHKLLLKLLEYDYTIEYKKGKENLVADALSRKDVLKAMQCNTATMVVPQWTEDVARSYLGD